MKKNNLTGRVFGNNTVIDIGYPKKHGKNGWLVKCSCGHIRNLLAWELRKGNKCVWCSHKEPRPYLRLRPYEAQYNIFVGRARFPVEITYEQFAELAQQKHCHYCGADVIWSEYRRADKRGGGGSNLDRKDYRLGYKLNNVVVCCGRCNYAKGTHFSYEEWKEIGLLIKKWGKQPVQPLTPVSGIAMALLEKELEK